MCGWGGVGGVCPHSSCLSEIILISLLLSNKICKRRKREKSIYRQGGNLLFFTFSFLNVLPKLHQMNLFRFKFFCDSAGHRFDFFFNFRKWVYLVGGAKICWYRVQAWRERPYQLCIFPLKIYFNFVFFFKFAGGEKFLILVFENFFFRPRLETSRFLAQISINLDILGPDPVPRKNLEKIQKRCPTATRKNFVEQTHLTKFLQKFKSKK